MVSEFILRAALAGIGVALVTGVLGCFIIWRRMVYFGDALSHASILGVAVSTAFGVSIYLGVASVAGVIALPLFALTTRWQSMDTILGVIAHSFLAIGLIAASVWGTGLTLEGILFGDVLAVTWTDVVVVWAAALGVLGFVAVRWNNLIAATVCDDLAASVGVRTKVEQLLLSLCLAVVVGVALKTVGALLITAFLIIPAAAARSFAQTPERMAVIASFVGIIGAIGGLAASYYLDWPAGPAMIAVSAGLFLVSRLGTVRI
jgi:zinc transport system permease protein